MFPNKGFRVKWLIATLILNVMKFITFFTFPGNIRTLHTFLDLVFEKRTPKAHLDIINNHSPKWR